LYFAAADAGRARAQTLVHAVHHGSHGLQIHIPPSVGDVVGVTDFMSKLRTFAANFANSCHLKETPEKIMQPRAARAKRNF
jgi:hypothetical protein